MARLILDRLDSGSNLVSMESEDLYTDQKRINRIFKNLGRKVTVSKDPDGRRL